MWHVFQQYSYISPEGQQSLDDIGRFIRRQTML
jgi:epsilon-lactone hydrolase